MSRLTCFIMAAVVCMGAAAAVDDGAGPCSASSVNITQTATGRSVESKPEFRVVIEDECPCTLLGVTLLCAKYRAGIKIDPPVFSVNEDGECVLNGPLRRGDPITFTYAADPISFQPLSFDRLACS